MSALLTTVTTQKVLQEDSQLGNRVRTASRKRKVYEDEVEDELGAIITIRQYNSPSNSSTKFTPRKLISRVALPLAYIASAVRQHPQLFTSTIPCLDKIAKLHELGPHVLIVQDDSNSLAAIERVNQGVYAICQLADWVRLEDFDRGPVKQARLARPQSKDASSIPEWWSAAAIVQPKTSMQNSEKLIDFVLSHRPQYEQSAQNGSRSRVEPVLVQQETTASAEQPLLGADPENIDWSTNIRQHYLEALYTTRASLAYFVKGPLSRARVADQTSQLKTTLTELLRANILPVKVRSNTAVVDKKYSQGIPNVLIDIPSGITFEDNGGLSELFKDRLSKSRRRRKISSEGLLPGEEEYIINWWINREATTAYEGLQYTKDIRLKHAIMDQKMRETQLQIILILEALALERASLQSFPIDIPTTEDSQNQLENQPENTQMQDSDKKDKKPQDLPRVLDVLVEKMQIWETMNGDVYDLASIADTRSGTKSSNCLKSFCLDIVLPFYTSRLADISKTLCRKFGVAVSPEKKDQKLKQSTSLSKTKARPGEPIKERRGRGPLDRVMSHERVPSKRKHITLTRSATDSLVPSIKQELDDISISNIPLHRPSVAQSKLFARREVDLAAEVKATQAKLKRKEEVERELQGAIFALKKPNARVAVKEFVDASDQRNGAQKSRSRKSQNPVRNSFAPGVQVTATPRVKRFLPSNETSCSTQAQDEEAEVVPPSSLPRIPSSSIKPTADHMQVPSAITISCTPSKDPFKRFRGSGFDKTPSKSIGKSVQNHIFSAMIEEHGDSGSEPDLPPLPYGSTEFKRPGLPIVPKSDMVVAAPAKAVRVQQRPTSEDNQVQVFSTPRKITSNSYGDTVLPSSPLEMRKPIVTVSHGAEQGQSSEEMSIYDALGWHNDDYDI